MVKKAASIFYFIISTLYLSNAQTVSPQIKKLNLYQDTLKTLGFEAVNNPNEAERYNASFSMIKTLTKALKVPNSFQFGFDSLKTVSIQLSPDRRFRIFSWHIMNNDGSYRYYGTIQMNTPGSSALKMYPLVDYTATIKKPQDTSTTHRAWYGAQYYRIIPVTYNVRTPYYILLGWKGNNVKSTKRVIEVLYFKDDKANFGMPVFDGSKEHQGKKRIIFEYNRQASMILNYIPKDGTIVFDHLASPDPNLKDKPELMGPDMSYDGFKLVNGRWKFVEDLQLKNSPTQNDNIFNDPRKPGKENQRKIPRNED
jgi:hypothetical protein